MKLKQAKFLQNTYINMYTSTVILQNMSILFLNCVFIATYSEDFFVECKACPAGYSCPNNKRPELCPFAADVGFHYSTENSKFVQCTASCTANMWDV